MTGELNGHLEQVYKILANNSINFIIIIIIIIINTFVER